MRLTLAISSACILSIPSLDALACGGGAVGPEPQSVGVDAQRVFLSVLGENTEIVTELSLPQTVGDWGVLIPVPVEPTIDPEPLDAEAFDQLDRETQVVVAPAQEEGGGGGCGSDGVEAGGGLRGGDLEEGDSVDVGPVTATVLSTDSGDALASWLGDNGFSVSADDQATIDTYATRGRFFVAIRRNETPLTGSTSRIGLHMTLAGDHRVFPLRMAKVGAAETVSFVLFLAGPEPLAPDAPFEWFTVDALDADLAVNESYAWAVEKEVEARGGRAWVVEGVWNRDAMTGFQLPDALRALTAPGQVVTRLSTRMHPEDLNDDASFFSSGEGTVPTTIQQPAQSGCRVGKRRAVPGVVALLAALALVAVGRRRK